jgi:hypothetical protein
MRSILAIRLEGSYHVFRKLEDIAQVMHIRQLDDVG